VDKETTRFANKIDHILLAVSYMDIDRPGSRSIIEVTMEDDTKKLLKALLAVSIEGRSEEAKKLKKDENLLADFGFNSTDIADILGKSKAAVAKAIQRGRKK
jgi:DNA-directed RNA polymerase specialized sigma24 family protein